MNAINGICNAIDNSTYIAQSFAGQFPWASNIGSLLLIFGLIIFAVHCFSVAFGKESSSSGIGTILGLLFAVVLFYMSYYNA